MIDESRAVRGPSKSQPPAPGLASLLGEVFGGWYRHNAPRLGAALAFYTILSLAPLLIVMIAVAGLISGRAAAENQIVWQTQNLAGRESAEVIRQLLEGVRKPASGVLAAALGVLTLFLGATAMVVELRDALNTVWDIPMQAAHWSRSVLRLLKERVFSFLMVLGAGLLLLVSLVVNVWLAAAGAFFHGWLPIPESVLEALSSVVSFVVIAALFALIYKFMPDVDLEWREVTAGAALTSLLFSLGKFLIGLYLGKSELGSTYGAAGSLVVLLIWVYYSAQVFLLGAEFTRVFGRVYFQRR